MRALILNCVPEGSADSSELMVQTFEGLFRQQGLEVGTIESSCLHSDPLDYLGPPDSNVIDAFARSRVLAVIVSADSWKCTESATEALSRIDTLLDRTKLGAKVGAPVSLYGAGEGNLRRLCCQLLGLGYLVPEQAWLSWPQCPPGERIQRCSTDLISVGSALAAADKRETISTYPPFRPSVGSAPSSGDTK